MPRRAARVDDNQPAIVQALRNMGCSVQPLHTVGGGCPDLLVGWEEKNYLMEIKDGSKIPSAQKLTPQQEKFFDEWLGQRVVVTSPEEAMGYILADSVPW